MGIGYATLHAAMPEPAPNRFLEILQVDRFFDQLAGVKGSGAEQRKRFLLSEIFRHATREEQEFLLRLMGGELRQGALEGIMLEALAKATNLPAERIRRAAMMAGGSTAIAQVFSKRAKRGWPNSTFSCSVRCSRCWRKRPKTCESALSRIGRSVA